MKPKVKFIGWRGLTHSFSIVNQYQLLGLKNLPVDCFHEEAPVPNPSWTRSQSGSGFPADAQGYIDQLPDLGPSIIPDYTYTIYYPLLLHTRESRVKTFVFSVNEYQELSTKTLDGNFYNAQGREDIHIITPSHWSKEGYINYGFPEEQITVITHGVDVDLFRPAKSLREANRKQLIDENNEFIFFSAGTMTFNKGIDLLLNAFSVLSERYKDIRLCLKDASSLGYSKASEVIRKFVNTEVIGKKLDPNKILLVSGNLSQDQMVGLYSAVDCYVSPYRAEGFGLTPLEAAACGCPIIVTKGGATDEYFHDLLGYQIDSTKKYMDKKVYLEPTLESLIEKMESAYLNRETHRVGASRRYILTNHSWEIVSAKLLGLFR